MRRGTAKADWLDEALRVVASQGAPALTLDRICERMGLSKGAFYHHFGSMQKFRASVLDRFEERHTTAVIAVVEESAGGVSARDRVRHLLDEALKDKGDGGAELEAAVRAWAKQDSEAAIVQARVDARRISYLRRLCEEAGQADPERMATMIYVTMIGAAHLTPPLTKSELRGLYEGILFPLL